MLQGDPFKTLFIARVSFDVTEKKLRREFEEFGPIKTIRLVHDKNLGACSQHSHFCHHGEPWCHCSYGLLIFESLKGAALTDFKESMC